MCSFPWQIPPAKPTQITCRQPAILPHIHNFASSPSLLTPLTSKPMTSNYAKQR
ncbi:hypothetical protein NC651_029227 [Populus alba x Populus x berolinensis]|nr:hypothetical protein NC651_029227 [Populus alba x Populus x berolinensis]